DQVQIHDADAIPGAGEVEAFGTGDFFQLENPTIKRAGAGHVGDVDGDVVDSLNGPIRCWHRFDSIKKEAPDVHPVLRLIFRFEENYACETLLSTAEECSRRCAETSVATLPGKTSSKL